MESQTRKKDGDPSSLKGKSLKTVRVKNKVSPKNQAKTAKEFGGPKGPEPTRFGDWEQKGRCSDF